MRALLTFLFCALLASTAAADSYPSKPVHILVPYAAGGGTEPEVQRECQELVGLCLWDIFSGQQLTGQQFSAGQNDWRRIAHIMADSVYETLTGERW